MIQCYSENHRINMRAIIFTVALLCFCNEALNYDLDSDPDEADNLRNETATLIADLQGQIKAFISEVETIKIKTLYGVIEQLTPMFHYSEDGISVIKTALGKINELEYAANRENVNVQYCLTFKPHIESFPDILEQEIEVTFNTIVHNMNNTFDNTIQEMEAINATVEHLSVELEYCHRDVICINKAAQIAILFSTQLIVEMRDVYESFDNVSIESVKVAAKAATVTTDFSANYVLNAAGIIRECINSRMPGFITTTTYPWTSTSTSRSTYPSSWSTTSTPRTTYPWTSTSTPRTTYPSSWPTTSTPRTTYPWTSTSTPRTSYPWSSSTSTTSTPWTSSWPTTSTPPTTYPWTSTSTPRTSYPYSSSTSTTSSPWTSTIPATTYSTTTQHPTCHWWYIDC